MLQTLVYFVNYCFESVSESLYFWDFFEIFCEKAVAERSFPLYNV